MRENEPIGPEVTFEKLNQQWGGMIGQIDTQLDVNFFLETLDSDMPHIRPDNFWFNSGNHLCNMKDSGASASTFDVPIETFGLGIETKQSQVHHKLTQQEEDDVSTNQNEYDIEHSAESFSLYAGNTKYQSIIPATIWSEYATGELDKQNWKRSRHNNYNFGTSYVSEMAKIAEHSHDAHIAFNIVMPELLSRMQQAASQQYARENALLPNDTTHFDTVDDSVAVASHKLPKNNRRKKSCTSPRKNIR
jgi:hypothetical protein